MEKSSDNYVFFGSDRPVQTSKSPIRKSSRYINNKYRHLIGYYTYEGQYNDPSNPNLPNGIGILKNDEGFEVLDGTFKNGYIDGQCIIEKDPTGSYTLYLGAFKKGRRHGQGSIYDSAGAILYEGEFNNDLPEGKHGVKYWSNKQAQCIGSFKGALCNGMANQYSKTGKLIEKGNFSNNRLDSDFSIRYFPNGTIYQIGKFTNGLFKGNSLYNYLGNKGPVIH